MKKKVLFLIVSLSVVPGFLLADKPDDAIHDFLSRPKSVFSGCASTIATLLKSDPEHTFSLVENWAGADRIIIRYSILRLVRSHGFTLLTNCLTTHSSGRQFARARLASAEFVPFGGTRRVMN